MILTGNTDSADPVAIPWQLALNFVMDGGACFCPGRGPEIMIDLFLPAFETCGAFSSPRGLPDIP